MILDEQMLNDIENENIQKIKDLLQQKEEIENPMKNKTLNVSISFKPYHTKVEFVFDTDMIVENIITENVRTMRTMINDDLYYTNKTFKIKENDNVRIQITQFEEEKESKIIFVGYEKDTFYNSDVVPEKVYDTEVIHENIIIE